MTCTWKSSSQSFANCKSNDLSYGGVTNFDVDNRIFFLDDYILAIPYKTSFRVPPDCRVAQRFLTANARVTAVGGISTESSLTLMLSDNNQGVKSTVKNRAYDVRVSVYCFAAMPAHGYLLQDKSTNVGVSLPSAWLFIDPVADSSAALGISFLQSARWDNIAGLLQMMMSYKVRMDL